MTGIAIRHRASILAADGTAAPMEQVVLPGLTHRNGFWNCQTQSGDGAHYPTAGPPCSKLGCSASCPCDTWGEGPIGRGDLWANASSGAAVGLAPLDDVFLVHAQAVNRAVPLAARVPGPQFSCPVSHPPAIELRENNFGLGTEPYTLEWAIYPFAAPHSDYFSYVNAHRHALGTDTLTLVSTCAATLCHRAVV